MAVLFGAGAVLMVGGAVLGWLLVVAAAAEDVHWIVGAAIFVLGIVATRLWPDMIRAPWQMWFGLWGYVDDWLENMGRAEEAQQKTESPKRIRRGPQ